MSLNKTTWFFLRKIQDGHQNKPFAWELWVMMEIMAADESTNIAVHIRIHGNKMHATNAVLRLRIRHLG